VLRWFWRQKNYRNDSEITVHRYFRVLSLCKENDHIYTNNQYVKPIDILRENISLKLGINKDQKYGDKDLREELNDIEIVING
jgi:hypothetical protein